MMNLTEKTLYSRMSETRAWSVENSYNKLKTDGMKGVSRKKLKELFFSLEFKGLIHEDENRSPGYFLKVKGPNISKEKEDVLTNNVYIGTVDLKELNWQVTVNGQPLPPRKDLRNHSPDGFAWGYGGSGPTQLALALLAYEYGEKIAQEHYQDFKRQVISNMTQDEGWELTSEDLKRLFDTI